MSRGEKLEKIKRWHKTYKEELKLNNNDLVMLQRIHVRDVGFLLKELEEADEEIALQDAILNPGNGINEQKRNGCIIAVLRTDLWAIQSKGKTAETAAKLNLQEDYAQNLIDTIREKEEHIVTLKAENEHLKSTFPGMVERRDTTINVLLNESADLLEACRGILAKESEMTTYLLYHEFRSIEAAISKVEGGIT